ncbi:MAG: glycosyltransferase [Candidatus Omnitrophota bacterium]
MLINTINVLHSPTDTGGNPWGLSRAERTHSVNSDVMVFRSSSYGYPADINLGAKKIFSPGRELKRYWFLCSAIEKYNVFHFNFGKSILDYPYFLLNHLDLPLLKRKGKKIFFTLQGTDARLMKTSALRYSMVPDFIKKRRINSIRRYADKIYALNPDLIRSCPEAEFLPYASVDIREWTPSQGNGFENTFHIIHLPSKRKIKGTKYIINAVNRLKQEGHRLDLLVVEKTPHNCLKDIYKKADLVVDQLLIGWYGAVSVEAMACGKPVVCYIKREDLQFIPQQMRNDLPVINAQPDTIYGVLKEIVKNRETLSGLGQKSRAYVERWHNPLEIAKKVIKDYENALCNGYKKR